MKKFTLFGAIFATNLRSVTFLKSARFLKSTGFLKSAELSKSTGFLKMAEFSKSRLLKSAKFSVARCFKATLLAATLAFTAFYPAKIHANNAIAIIVNNEPITTYEIDKAMKVLKISKDEVIEALINERLQDAQIKKMGSLVDDFELENEIKRSVGGTDEGLNKLKAELASTSITYESFKKDFKKQMERQRLYEAVASGAKVDYSDEGARTYYEQHKDEFVVYASVSARLYSGDDEQRLENFRQNAERIAALSEKSAAKALKNAIPKGVRVQDEVLTANNADPRLLVFLSRFESHQFSPVIEDGVGGFVLYEVLSKSAPQQLAFEQIAEQVGQIYIAKQRQDYIKDFFDKQLAKAEIKRLR